MDSQKGQLCSVTLGWNGGITKRAIEHACSSLDKIVPNLPLSGLHTSTFNARIREKMIPKNPPPQLHLAVLAVPLHHHPLPQPHVPKDPLLQPHLTVLAVPLHHHSLPQPHALADRLHYQRLHPNQRPPNHLLHNQLPRSTRSGSSARTRSLVDKLIPSSVSPRKPSSGRITAEETRISSS